MQTQLWSLYAVETYLPYIKQMNATYGSKCEVLGVVSMLLDKKGAVDKDVVRKAKEVFGSILFENYIYNRQRVKRYSAEGIPLILDKSSSIHDKTVINMYNKLNLEILSRMGDKK